MLPDLLSQIAPDQENGSVIALSADLLCKSSVEQWTKPMTWASATMRSRHSAQTLSSHRRRMPSYRSRTQPEARARNEAVRSSKCPGCAVWRRWVGYHRQSRVETKMHCVKLLKHPAFNLRLIQPHRRGSSIRLV